MEQLNQLSWTQVFVAGLILTLIYYFTAYNNGSIYKQEIATETKQLSQAQIQLDTINRALAQKKELDQEIDLVTQQFQNVRKYLPVQQGESDLMSMVMDVARSVGTDEIHIQPTSSGGARSDKSAFYEPVVISIDFDATFSKVMLFLSGITQIPRLLNVGSVSITNSDASMSATSPVLHFKSNLIGYRFVDHPNKAKKKGSK